MVGKISFAGRTMGELPITTINTDYASLLIDYCVDAKGRLNETSYALTFLMNGIAIEESRANTRLAPAFFKVERQHVRTFNCRCRCKAGTNCFLSTTKTSNVTKTH